MMRWKNFSNLVALPVTLLFAGMLCSLAGCAITPKPMIDQPMTARPPQPEPKDKANPGSIYQASQYRPLFEDVRARMVGDAIIITIAENTSSTTTTGNALSKSSATST